MYTHIYVGPTVLITDHDISDIFLCNAETKWKCDIISMISDT